MRKRSGSLLGAVLLAVGLGLVGYTLYSWFAEPADTTPVDARIDANNSALYADTAPWNQSTPLSQAGALGDRSYAALPGASLAVTEAAPAASNSTTSTTTPSAMPSTTSDSTKSPSTSATPTPSPDGTNITPLPGATVSSNSYPGATNSNTDPTGPTTPLSGTAEPTPSTTQPTVPFIDPPGSSLPSSIHVDATSPGMTTAPTPVAPATHKIESGDTLGSIAKKYLGKESRWTEIAKLNPGLDPHRLKIGDVVKLPEVSRSDAITTSPTGWAGATNASDPPSEIVVPLGSQTHTVREGDTFWIIAEQYYGSGVHWQSIYQANKPIVGANPDKLTTGMKLIIPPKPGGP